MRFRQVHLDFHTSEFIEGIGDEFSKADFQEQLIRGHIDSITIFAKCCHGWVYYDSALTRKHPYLKFDLLKEMITAAHEIDVKTPVYFSVGLEEKEVRNHPEWLIRGRDERTTWVKSLLDTGWHRFCNNNAHQQLNLEQIREVVEKYDLDELFLDVSSAIPCYCQNCISTLLEQNKDPLDIRNIWELSEDVYREFSEKTARMVHSIKPGLPIFHNGGYVQRGRRDMIQGNTHLELESLPTGGWGYDHFPISALYAQSLGVQYSGMTGKFHLAWGEFGGFKHPNGLKYETSLFLTYGARCSIGDQLHPSGKMDIAAYDLIGSAYAEVEKKEKYLEHVKMVNDIAVLSLEAMGAYYHQHNLVAMAEQETLGEVFFEDNLIAKAAKSDVGAFRLLKECGFLFTIIDVDMRFEDYKVIIIPDHGVIDQKLKEKLSAYILQGGKIYLSGMSGKMENSDEFFMDLGFSFQGEAMYQPIFIHPSFELEYYKNSNFIIYGKAYDIKVAANTITDKQQPEEVEILADFVAPYFNRTPYKFCSHMHAPSSKQSYGPAICAKDNYVYAAFYMFEDYKENASFIVKEIFSYTMNQLLGNNRTIVTNMPSQSTITLMQNDKDAYYLNHLLYASPIKRGDKIEVIEDIVPLYNVKVELRLPKKVRAVTLVPQEIEIPYEYKDDTICYTVPEVYCHQMVLIDYIST